MPRPHPPPLAIARGMKRACLCPQSTSRSARQAGAPSPDPYFCALPKPATESRGPLREVTRVCEVSLWGGAPQSRPFIAAMRADCAAAG